VARHGASKRCDDDDDDMMMMMMMRYAIKAELCALGMLI
jgi:hypothetical protein